MQANAVTVAVERQLSKESKKARKRKPMRVKIADAYQWRCYWCTQGMTSELGFMHTCTVEHIVPRSEGGANTKNNFASACHRCNGLRGTEAVEVFALLARDLKPDTREVASEAKKNARARRRRRRADQARAAQAFRNNTGHLLEKNTRAYSMYCKLMATRGPTGIRGVFRKLVNLVTRFLG